jgi:hypothetical protein
MNDTLIVAAYVMTDDVMSMLGHQDHCLAKVSDAEVLTVAVVAARYFQNHHERALWVMCQTGYLTHRLSTSRFNRRLHGLSEWLELLIAVLGEVLSQGEIFIIDSMPLPVCHRKRAWRCQKVRGRAYWGYCASKEDYFFGWKLHLVCTPQGMPVAFEMLPASYHDLTPLHELAAELPVGSCLLGDKGYNSLNDEIILNFYAGVRLIPRRRKDMAAVNSPADRQLLRQHRSVIETVNSQLEKMGLQRLHARTHSGFRIKVLSSLLALTLANAF